MSILELEPFLIESSPDDFAAGEEKMERQNRERRF